jgi:hypothetical protein
VTGKPFAGEDTERSEAARGDSCVPEDTDQRGDRLRVENQTTIYRVVL